MCVKGLISKLFAKPDILVLPHPEESPILTGTTENTDIKSVIENWLTAWHVINPDFWRHDVDIELSLLFSPEGTYGQQRLIYIHPQWAVPGVIAHGAGHVVYEILSDEEKASFQVEFSKALETDKLLQLAYAEKPYMQTNAIETHADTYRYLGEKVPESLRKYYPNLL